MYSEYLDKLPETDRICNSVMQLPSGQSVSEGMVESICEIIINAHNNASAIRKVLGK